MMFGKAAVACFNIGHTYVINYKIMLDLPCILKRQRYGLASGNSD